MCMCKPNVTYIYIVCPFFKELSATSNALGEVFSHVICFLVLPSYAQDCQDLLGMGDPHSLKVKDSTFHSSRRQN